MSDRFKVQKKITYNSGTFRITIPKMFIENLGLKEGDDVTLIYKDNKTLIITTEE
ncbi:MAG: AbrB/MazE/SpoVT family DNA-binding domain-containing protein [Candidatus Heimdallarchaeota archaeon]|nr:AbrB/MazE/SpoVT family DNA-binding domain-containing protein [Candidatus Heimdallarchaeota archaeon]